MALVIGSTPTPDPPFLSDRPLVLTLSTSGSLHPNWVGEYGSSFTSNSFSARHVSPTTFHPSAKTGEATVTGYRVYWATDSGVVADNAYAGVYGSGPGSVGWLSGLGTEGAWNAGIMFANLTDTHGFIEVKIPANQLGKEKFFGYTQSNVGMYGAAPENTTIRFIWQFLEDGTAIPRAYGVIIGSPVVANEGDVFKIDLTATGGAKYIKNDVVVYTAPLGAGTGAAPVFCFKHFSAYFDDVIFYIDNEATP